MKINVYGYVKVRFQKQVVVGNLRHKPKCHVILCSILDYEVSRKQRQQLKLLPFNTLAVAI